MKISDQTRAVLAACWRIAEQTDNDFIGLGHFYLACSELSDGGKKFFDLEQTQRSELMDSLKGQKLGGALIQKKPPSDPSVLDASEDVLFFLTRDLEIAIKDSMFQKWILKEKEVEPFHIYLAALSKNIANKDSYLRILTDNGIQLSSVKRAMINLHFHRVWRVLAIEKLVSRIF